MNRKTKIMFITATLVLWLLAGGIIGGSIYLTKKFKAKFIVPEAIEVEGVLIGGKSFSKSILHKDLSLGYITDIKIKSKDSFISGELVLAASSGAVFLDLKDPSVVNSSVYFEDYADFIEVIDVEGDGVEEFMGRGCWCTPPVVIDSEGSTTWRYERTDEKVIDMVSADMDGDGELEFIAGLKDGGIRIIDRNDKKLFKENTPPVSHVEVTDVNGDGALDIIFTTTKGELVVIDSSGKELSRTKFSEVDEGGVKVKDFTLARWPTVNDTEYILSASDGVVRLHDLSGKVVEELKVERAFDEAYLKGAGFKGVGGEDYLAVLLTYDDWERSVLLIYDDALKVVYEEVFLGLNYSLAVGSAMGEDDSDSVLVGGYGRLFNYTSHEGGRTE